jgi:glycosyltransferase involved in cell wall biosynthesis
MSSVKPFVLLMGQTPPPWHGQAVATQILFDHEWEDYEVHRLRMEFSEEMLEVGRFQWKKIQHLWRLIRKARMMLRSQPNAILFYPPASANWIPFLRDVIFLAAVRPLAAKTIFIFHASGLPVFSQGGWLRKILSKLVYHHADVSLEVAQEAIPAHQIFHAKKATWCPCGIAVPELTKPVIDVSGPLKLLFIASLQEGKGVLEILKTASILKNKGRENDYRFQIVGKWFSSEFESEARRLHQEMGLDQMVEFSGQLTGDDKWQAYANSHVFFFPTHYASEATPIVIMEALGMGLPILTTAWAGIPAMLEGCKTAEVRPVRDPQAYAEAAELFHSRLPELNAQAVASQEFYRSRYLPERFIERVRQAFDDVSPAFKSCSLSNICVQIYLADQNPGFDRSFGISRMTQMVMRALHDYCDVNILATTSKTSQRPELDNKEMIELPWGTRSKFMRFLTDHFHPLFGRSKKDIDVHFYPKGYLPFLSAMCRPSVVTIHDTIIQYDQDRYPKWRSRWEYAYWSLVLRHTLRKADRILTVSESSREQIRAFMARHKIPAREITVTYEPCAYENVAQPENPAKGDNVIHLASVEPHKRTAHLIRWWYEAELNGKNLPSLHLIGSIPPEVLPILSKSKKIVKRPFLEDHALQDAYKSAKALILPSEIEGFGLPALEAYYLGTPVCFVEGTSVEEVLGVTTHRGGFSLESIDSMISALEDVMSMTSDEVRTHGLKLRETYASEKVAARLMAIFQDLARK